MMIRYSDVEWEQIREELLDRCENERDLRLLAEANLEEALAELEKLKEALREQGAQPSARPAGEAPGVTGQ